jgi:hypothetical protein
MATDANLVLQASVTKTSSFNGAWLSLLGLSGAGGRALWAHVLYSAATNASGSNAFTFSLDVSPDGGTTAYTGAFSASDQVVTLSTTAQAGEISIPFSLLDPTLIAGATPAIRLVATQNGAGSTPTITYVGYVELGFN